MKIIQEFVLDAEKKKMTRKEDQLEISNIPCNICNEQSSGIIRTREVCKRCYSILRRDNIFRFSKDMDIPNSFAIFRYCFKDNCNNIFETKLTYKPEFCKEHS